MYAFMYVCVYAYYKVTCTHQTNMMQSSGPSVAVSSLVYQPPALKSYPAPPVCALDLSSASPHSNQTYKLFPEGCRSPKSLHLSRPAGLAHHAI